MAGPEGTRLFLLLANPTHLHATIRCIAPGRCSRVYFPHNLPSAILTVQLDYMYRCTPETPKEKETVQKEKQALEKATDQMETSRRSTSAKTHCVEKDTTLTHQSLV